MMSTEARPDDEVVIAFFPLDVTRAAVTLLIMGSSCGFGLHQISIQVQLEPEQWTGSIMGIAGCFLCKGHVNRLNKRLDEHEAANNLPKSWRYTN
jgi:hypothetical protein